MRRKMMEILGAYKNFGNKSKFLLEVELAKFSQSEPRECLSWTLSQLKAMYYE